MAHKNLFWLPNENVIQRFLKPLSDTTTTTNSTTTRNNKKDKGDDDVVAILFIAFEIMWLFRFLLNVIPWIQSDLLCIFWRKDVRTQQEMDLGTCCHDCHDCHTTLWAATKSTWVRGNVGQVFSLNYWLIIPHSQGTTSTKPTQFTVYAGCVLQQWILGDI